jgi:hypothetical protein
MSLIVVSLHTETRLSVDAAFKYRKIEMKNLLCLLVMLGLCGSAFARTDGGGKGGKGNGYKAPQKYNNPSGGENCYYCWKDLSTDYTPSRHKYAKKS